MGGRVGMDVTQYIVRKYDLDSAPPHLYAIFIYTPPPSGDQGFSVLLSCFVGTGVVLRAFGEVTPIRPHPILSNPFPTRLTLRYFHL